MAVTAREQHLCTGKYCRQKTGRAGKNLCSACGTRGTCKKERS